MITGQILDGAYLAKATGDLNIYTAAECCTQLRHLIDANASIVLDLSAVSEMDTAGVQLLVQVRRACDAQGKPLRFASPSAAVQDVVQLLQLHELLDMPGVGHAASSIQSDTP